MVGDDDDDDDATDDGKDKYENVDQFIRDSYTKQALGWKPFYASTHFQELRMDS